MIGKKIEEANRFILKEVDKRVEIIIQEVDARIADAYRKGYEDATTDVCRRLDDIYKFGFEIGKADALAEAGMIELDDDVTEALGE